MAGFEARKRDAFSDGRLKITRDMEVISRLHFRSTALILAEYEAHIRACYEESPAKITRDMTLRSGLIISECRLKFGGI